MLATDFISSYTVFTYSCRDNEFLPPIGTSIIGFYHNDFPSVRINHGATRRVKPHLIGCINQPSSPWVNVVYRHSADEILGEAQVSLVDDWIATLLGRNLSSFWCVCVCVCVVEFWRTLLFCQGFFYCVLSPQLMSVRWITEAASRFVPILSSLRTVAVETDMSWTTMESLAQVKIECSYCICTV